jgi:hypothetical protein
MNPYVQIKLNENTLLREFSASHQEEEYSWHRDENDRVIEVFTGSNWFLQLDDQLPILLEADKKYYIPARTWHRLHKGANDLVVLISEGRKKKKKRRKKKKADGFRSVEKGADNNPKVTKMDFLPAKVLDKIAKEKQLDEKRKKRRKRRKKRKSTKSKLTPGYKRNRSKSDQSRLASLTKQYRDADTKAEKMAAIKARDAFEKTQYKSKTKSKHNYKRRKKRKSEE